MFEAIGGFLWLALTAVAGIAAFSISREFVRSRLRFVDAVKHPAVPWLVGAAVLLVAWPIAGLLPLITAGTAAFAGVMSGLGTASGVKARRRGD